MDSNKTNHINMENQQHFLSKSAEWTTEAEFVRPNGTITSGKGKSKISIEGDRILNQSHVVIEGNTRENNYSIERVSDSRLEYHSENPELGTQFGTFHIDRNVIYSKFHIENTKLYGFEIITRFGDECLASGAMYQGDSLVNSWRAVMKMQSKS
jgi:hypothetical protein